jgi:uncharacterized protein YjbI with pentapeptide repeats
MDEQTDQRLASPPRPTGNDRHAWQGYWQQLGQPWRTEPEIDTKRQEQLASYRARIPDIKQGIYPFKGMKLSRADVEWLLATHENGRGPLEWSDESQREREGLDVRGADLRGVDLRSLPLARLCGGLALSQRPSKEERNMAAVILEGADLRNAHLEGANLSKANLQNADLWRAHLEGTDLNKASLQGSYLIEAHLTHSDLSRAQLEGAELANVMLSDEKHVGPLLADVKWENTNLAVVEWSQMYMLGDEYKARQQTQEGQVKARDIRQHEYEIAVRANRQLALALQAQGLNEDAARFAYRAQLTQRRMLGLRMLQHRVPLRQRWQALGAWLFSWFLEVFTGYGYKPERCFVAYLLAVVVFTMLHYIVGAVAGSPLTWLSALAVSVQSLHGRIFSFQPSDPQTLLNTIEAFVGLFIEAIVVAVITQRILGK